MKLTPEEAKRIAWSLKDYASNMGMILHIYTSDPLFECKNPMLALGEMMAQREIMHRTTPLVQDAVDSIYGKFVRALYDYWSKQEGVPGDPTMRLEYVLPVINEASRMYRNEPDSPMWGHFVRAVDREHPIEDGVCELDDLDDGNPCLVGSCSMCKHYVPVSDKEKEA